MSNASRWGILGLFISVIVLVQTNCNGNNDMDVDIDAPVKMPLIEQDARTLIIVSRRGCGACEKLKADWPQGFPHVGSYAWKEDSETARKYKVNAVPTLVIIDENGQELKRHVGYMSMAELLVWLEGDGCCLP